MRTTTTTKNEAAIPADATATMTMAHRILVLTETGNYGVREAIAACAGIVHDASIDGEIENSGVGELTFHCPHCSTFMPLNHTR